MSKNTNENTNDLFDEEFGDLLSDAKVVASEPKAEVPVKQAPVVTEEAAKAVVEKEKEDTSDFVTFGTKITSVPIPRFKASQQSKSRISIISKKILAVKTHYVQGIGSFVCMDGKCCEFEGLPKVRYLIPVVVYTTNKSGAIIGDDIELRVLALGSDSYDTLVQAVSLSGRDIQDVDIVVSCSDEQYQKVSFAADASTNAKWKTFSTAKELVEKYKANKDKLYLAIARKISMETYLSKKGVMSNNAPQMTSVGSSIDDLLDD